MFQRNEEAFFANLDEIEIGEVKKKQELEVKNLKLRQEQSLKDFNNRKNAKKFQRSQQRELKDLYINTQFRADLFKKTEEIKVALRQIREKSVKVLGHIEERHLKQVKQFNQAEERGFADQKVLIELECENLTEEQRSETMKKFQSKVNHQKVVNKKKLDHIREQQRLELRQYKEKGDNETRMIEELANLKETQSQTEQDVIAEQRHETIAEKEKVQATQKSLKIMDMQAENVMEMTKLQANHRIQLRQLLRTQKDRKVKRYKHWSGIINRDILLEHASMNGSMAGSQIGSAQPKSIAHSIAHSRKNSNPDLKEGKLINYQAADHAEDAQDAKLLSGQSEWKAEEAKDQLLKMQQGLLEVKKKHERALYGLKQSHEASYTDLKEQFQQESTEMEWRHEVEKKRLATENDAEIEEALANQEKEIIMEGHIRKAETKALIERKVLNNLLDTFVDGVISIDPRGFVKRFNHAAEKMFGYTMAEITEKNMNIKSLMPKKYSDDHDSYLYNYFSTGVKKVLGIGRQVAGLKKDGTEFPIHLAVSEVVEDGFHLFTAIVRDLTEVIEEENYKQSTESQMMWKVEKSGKAVSVNQKFKHYVGITTKDEEDKADVFSPDVVHPLDLSASREAFSNANRTMKPFEIKRRLKSFDGSYRWFLTKGIPVYDTKGTFRFWCGECSDINDVVTLEEEMNTLQEKLSVFLWKSNPSGDLYYGNSGFMHYSGINFQKEKTSLYGPEVICDFPFFNHMNTIQICFEEDIPKLEKSLQVAREKKSAIDLKIRMKSQKGIFKWFHITGSPIIDGNGSLLSFYGICSVRIRQVVQVLIIIGKIGH